MTIQIFRLIVARTGCERSISRANFFKHADVDSKEMLEFDESENEGLLLDAVLLYGAVGGEYLSAASVFIGWLTTRHPELRDAVSNDQIGDFCVRNGISPERKQEFLELIDAKILLERKGRRI